MKNFYLDKNSEYFEKIELHKILKFFNPVAEKYQWSIKLIDAVGDITGVTGFSILDLEKKCEDSDYGYLVDWPILIKLSEALLDIIDLVLVASENLEKMPRSFSKKEWNEKCHIWVSKEDSSVWEIGFREANMDVESVFFE